MVPQNDAENTIRRTCKQWQVSADQNNKDTYTFDKEEIFNISIEHNEEGTLGNMILTGYIEGKFEECNE